MKKYIVIRSFIFSSKTYAKDKLVSADDVGESIIRRLVKRGFLKSAEEMAATYEEPAFYEQLGDYLLPEQVNKLKKQELLDYAKHLKMPNVDPAQNMADLRDSVNRFIVILSEGGAGGTGA